NIVELEKPFGVILQFGGQTPLKLARALETAGVPILGTSPSSIDLAEDRNLFAAVADKLGLKQPANGMATNLEEALAVAARIEYPVLLRPSFVLGGRAMAIVYSEGELRHYMETAVEASPERPVLVDKFLSSAMEVDVDAVSDGETVVVAGIMQHIEEAGIHSGDSACFLPPQDISAPVLETLRAQAVALAQELGVVGLMNIQFAVKDEEVYILEVNPRGSRTVPFVSKVLGAPLTKIATKAMIGKSLKTQGFTTAPEVPYVAVKESVFPFAKFHGVDTLLSPEMKSTGEVMGIDPSAATAFAKAQIAAGNTLPVAGSGGQVFLSLNDRDKDGLVPIARELESLGFDLLATEGTTARLRAEGIACRVLNKVSQGSPHIVDLIQAKQCVMLINTPQNRASVADDGQIRKAALLAQIPYTTTLSGARAAVAAIAGLKKGEMGVRSLQEYHAGT